MLFWQLELEMVILFSRTVGQVVGEKTDISEFRLDKVEEHVELLHNGMYFHIMVDNNYLIK